MPRKSQATPVTATPRDLTEIAPLAHELQRRRVEQHLTLEGLEARTGIAKNTLSLYENRRVNPTALALLKIARGLETNLSELVGVLDHLPKTGHCSDAED